MHDDDVPVTPEPWEPEPYWTEDDWERFMVENERLMDRYEQVWKDHPDRRWDDPLDLYYKVHYDLDLGEEPARSSLPRPPVPSEEPTHAVEPAVPGPPDEVDDFRGITAYQLAYAFSLGLLDYLKRFHTRQPGRDLLVEAVCRHGLRIAADIAGGHGLGYDEETLCGNIVKNRWALNHAQEAQQLLIQLAQRESAAPELAALQAQLPPLITALRNRIASLRTKAWWSK